MLAVYRIDNNSLYCNSILGEPSMVEIDKVQFWARLETEIADLFGVYSRAFTIHSTVGRTLFERGIEPFFCPKYSVGVPVEVHGHLLQSRFCSVHTCPPSAKCSPSERLQVSPPFHSISI